MRFGRAQAAVGTLNEEVAGSILLVEDEPSIRQLMATMLEQEGYRVVQAKNGVEALAQFDSRIDVLVTDIRLPYMDGRLLIDELRSRRRTLPVVAISAYALNAPTAPDVLFLAKPFTHEQLLEAVRAVIPQF